MPSCRPHAATAGATGLLPVSPQPRPLDDPSTGPAPRRRRAAGRGGAARRPGSPARPARPARPGARGPPRPWPPNGSGPRPSSWWWRRARPCPVVWPPILGDPFSANSIRLLPSTRSALSALHPDISRRTACQRQLMSSRPPAWSAAAAFRAGRWSQFRQPQRATRVRQVVLGAASARRGAPAWPRRSSGRHQHHGHDDRDDGRDEPGTVNNLGSRAPSWTAVGWRGHSRVTARRSTAIRTAVAIVVAIVQARTTPRALASA